MTILSELWVITTTAANQIHEKRIHENFTFLISSFIVIFNSQNVNTNVARLLFSMVRWNSKTFSFSEPDEWVVWCAQKKCPDWYRRACIIDIDVSTTGMLECIQKRYGNDLGLSSSSASSLITATPSTIRCVVRDYSSADGIKKTSEKYFCKVIKLVSHVCVRSVADTKIASPSAKWRLTNIKPLFLGVHSPRWFLGHLYRKIAIGHNDDGDRGGEC